MSTTEAVGVACGAGMDIVLNYPPWVVAKRLGAGLSAVPHGKGLASGFGLYCGGGALLCSTAPTWILQERLTAFLGKGPLAACLAGAVGGLCVASQIEGCITKAHVWKTTPLGVIRLMSLRALVLPRGMVMTMCREVPCSGCLFFLRDWITERLEERLNGGAGHLGVEVLSAYLAAFVAGPLSHPQSVVAARQQAKDITIKAAMADIRRASPHGLWTGVVPRTVALGGTLFIVPYMMKTVRRCLLQPAQGALTDTL
ncbi:hypothetical protein FOZ63_007845 [Perkinsus olseni]|uniref:Mitochondrial carrier protein n=1 Tax=Perkinsus olseni TaxID=32597 RepID=A0A7J6QCB3_PEROL|nr:hypothetical protein FOZ63_007845 [Perkinsus olseni]KAF4713015.1 hypothetical protein FOZ62_024000 [Perkinsus olseni]